MAKNKVCQSCGAVIDRKNSILGTEADGSRSQLYCDHCYKDGKFLHPNLTLEEVKKHYVEKFVELKVPRWVAKLMVRSVDKLERWKNK